MNYRTEQALRWVAFIGLIALAFSQPNGWVWGIYVGAVIWAATIPWTMSAFMSRSIPGIWVQIRSLWSRERPREERVPESVKRMAARLGVNPPKRMMVVPGFQFNAWVNEETLVVTEILWSSLWTTAAEGILAHEMAHLSGKHSGKKRWATFGLIFSIIVVVALVDNLSWSVWFAVALTIWPLFMPLLSRRLEYNADKQAAKVVGVETMSLSLRVLTERSRWHLELDSHPSIQKRLENLKKLELAGMKLRNSEGLNYSQIATSA